MDEKRTRRDLMLFAGLTLVFSWGLLLAAGLVGPDIGSGPAQVLFALGTSGPTLVALGLWLAGRRRPRSGARPLRTLWRWLPAALAFGFLPTFLGIVAAPLVGGPAPDWSLPGAVVAGNGGIAVVFAMLLITGPLAEEFGWRGYAQPRMRRWLGPVATSVVLGSGWVLWHLPLFFLPGTSQHQMGLFSVQTLLWAVSMLPLSYLALHVSERLGGGVAAAVALHAASNAALSLFGPFTVPAGILAAALFLGTAGAVGLVGRSQRRSQSLVSRSSNLSASAMVVRSDSV